MLPTKWPCLSTLSARLGVYRRRPGCSSQHSRRSDLAWSTVLCLRSPGQRTGPGSANGPLVGRTLSPYVDTRNRRQYRSITNLGRQKSEPLCVKDVLTDSVKYVLTLYSPALLTHARRVFSCFSLRGSYRIPTTGSKKPIISAARLSKNRLV